MNGKGQDQTIFGESLNVRSRAFFTLFLVILIAQFIDLILGSLSDLFIDFTVSPLGVGVFITVGIIYGVAQYLILKTVKATIGESEAKNLAHISLTKNAVMTIQYVLLGIIAFTVLQIIFNSQYYTGLLAIGATISYALAAVLTGLLAYLFFSWFRRNRALVVVIYGLAAAMIAVNAIDTIILFDIVIFGTKPVLTAPDSEVIFPDLTEMGFSWVIDIQAVSLNGYFILMWAGTILLLRHNIQRIGRVKFWVLVAAPMVFFMNFYIIFYESVNASPIPPDEGDISAILLPVMLIMFSGVAATILFGLGFRSIAGSISQTNKVHDYMMITAYGFILFFTAAGATISGAGYPPFGLVNVSLVGPFSYLILIGLYGSAVSIAHDAKLRRSIKASTREELKLLDSIGISEIQRETERKVFATTKANAATLTQQTGIEPTLTEEEIHQILSQVASEIRREKQRGDDQA